VGCLLENSQLPLPDLNKTCLGSGEAGGDTAIFGGVYDPGLLTRSQPLETDTRPLSSYFVRAGVLYAKLARAEGEPINVFCTHLGSELDGIAYQGPLGSWEGEHAQQVSELLAYVAEKAPTGPVMIVGDLNTGVGEWDSHYQTLLDAGYQCPAMDAQICTECPENTFRADDGAPKLIDHVLLRELSATRVEKALTEVVTFKAGESDVTSSLSDHYGLSATVH
jgi:endonuclease/exonuclease/phosphatase family metal-dependent hydrolase